MRGRPITGRCPKCKLRAVSGAAYRIWYTGKERRPANNPRRGRQSGGEYVQYYNYCGCCDHEWWSTHRGITPRVAVTGGRRFNDPQLIHDALLNVHETYGFPVLIHGEAPGADVMAGEWATNHGGIEVISKPANWKRYAKAAGPIRNRAMLLQDKPNILVVFPGGSGTRDMTDICKEAGLLILYALELVK
jgi:hypothetical protein